MKCIVVLFLRSDLAQANQSSDNYSLGFTSDRLGFKAAPDKQTMSEKDNMTFALERKDESAYAHSLSK